MQWLGLLNRCCARRREFDEKAIARRMGVVAVLVILVGVTFNSTRCVVAVFNDLLLLVSIFFVGKGEMVQRRSDTTIRRVATYMCEFMMSAKVSVRISVGTCRWKSLVDSFFLTLWLLCSTSFDSR